jgi:Fe-S-cluster-containing dehydrogenase component
MPDYGLLVDYEYCTGCNACEVACKQEYRRPAGKTGGIKVLELIQEAPGGKLEIIYFPMLTRQCIFCGPRIERGLLPSCVQHCMAQCLTFGPVEELANKTPRRRKAVLWTQGKEVPLKLCFEPGPSGGGRRR